MCYGSIEGPQRFFVSFCQFLFSIFHTFFSHFSDLFSFCRLLSQLYRLIFVFHSFCSLIFVFPHFFRFINLIPSKKVYETEKRSERKKQVDKTKISRQNVKKVKTEKNSRQNEIKKPAVVIPCTRAMHKKKINFPILCYACIHVY